MAGGGTTAKFTLVEGPAELNEEEAVQECLLEALVRMDDAEAALRQSVAKAFAKHIVNAAFAEMFPDRVSASKCPPAQPA